MRLWSSTKHLREQTRFAVRLTLVPVCRVGMHRLSFTRFFDRSLMFESGSYASSFGYITELEDMHSHTEHGDEKIIFGWAANARNKT
jgi:hypothetical protein